MSVPACLMCPTAAAWAWTASGRRFLAWNEVGSKEEASLEFTWASCCLHSPSGYFCQISILEKRLPFLPLDFSMNSQT